MWLIILTEFSKLKNFSGLEAVMYAVNVAITCKQCKMLLYTAVAYRIAATLMTLSDVQGHLLNVGLYKRDFSCNCAAVDKISAAVVRHAVRL